MAVRASKLAHMLMVRSLVLDLKKKGFRKIRADLAGLARPPRVEGAPEDETYVPDVTGDSREHNVFEVETADTIYDEHTADQWKNFADYARERHGRFWVVVPKGAADDARWRLDRLHVSANVLEI
ncbi:MAG: hypothetical protein HY900_32970 [Deltaproteobacteria bacterium]|nr:hypothetical protein [Deltaproteobacteria bacterium]